VEEGFQANPSIMGYDISHGGHDLNRCGGFAVERDTRHHPTDANQHQHRKTAPIRAETQVITGERNHNHCERKRTPNEQCKIPLGQ